MRRSIRSLQAAVTVTALFIAQAPAFAQGPAPAPAPTASPAPAPAPAPGPAPAPTASPAPAPAPGPAPADPGAWSPTGETPPPDAATPAEPPPAEPAPPVEAAPAPEPAPAPVGPTPPPAAPVDTVAAKKLKNAGTGVMLAGGVLSLAGFAATLAFTLKGNKLEKDLVGAEDEYSKNNCSSDPGGDCKGITANRDDIREGIKSANSTSMVTGGILAGGILVVAVGGILYRVGVKRLTNTNLSRFRVSPTFGGLSISGRF